MIEIPTNVVDMAEWKFRRRERERLVAALRENPIGWVMQIKFLPNDPSSLHLSTNHTPLARWPRL